MRKSGFLNIYIHGNVKKVHTMQTNKSSHQKQKINKNNSNKKETKNKKQHWDTKCHIINSDFSSNDRF